MADIWHHSCHIEVMHENLMWISIIIFCIRQLSYTIRDKCATCMQFFIFHSLVYCLYKLKYHFNDFSSDFTACFKISYYNRRYFTVTWLCLCRFSTLFGIHYYFVFQNSHTWLRSLYNGVHKMKVFHASKYPYLLQCNEA